MNVLLTFEYVLYSWVYFHAYYSYYNCNLFCYLVKQAFSLHFSFLNSLYVCMYVPNHSVVSNSLWPYGQYPARLLCPSILPVSWQEYWSGLPFLPPGGSSWLRDPTHVSCIGRRILYLWATWEDPEFTEFLLFIFAFGHWSKIA